MIRFLSAWMLAALDAEVGVILSGGARVQFKENGGDECQTYETTCPIPHH
jgi:hypothetical protein